MEHLSLIELAHLFEFLVARDVASVTRTCRALSADEPVVQQAIGLVLKHRFGDVLGFLREEQDDWPRSPLLLRCAEVLRVKQILSTAVFAPEDGSLATKRSPVIISKAWTLAWKKRCQLYEQFVQQFRLTKKKQQQQRDKRNKAAVVRTGDFKDSEAVATKEASALIVCPHDKLLPLSFCVARARRAVVSRASFRVLSAYAHDVRGFSTLSTPDCIDCLQEKAETDRQEELQRQERFEMEIGSSVGLVDLLLRKNGYPNELFSPATSRGNTLLSLSHNTHHTFYLVPKKWLVKWRKYVRSLADDVPGPILNAELVCDAHQRSIVPPYITMFLSGFSLEVSLQATQALGASASTQYELVTSDEWDALFDRYCAEFAVGFDVVGGSYHWKTAECNVCHYGMGASLRRERRNPNSYSSRR
ncbi:hypothetical protein Poli38472_000543 [Pythium oligandrum]|uniref:DUSP domain-containing protein n=1 Tax=Pythium oligandrum TaxID=41045 RepID=A0A8K1CBX6_PYTOL|nr:hypothetical protein Poli38472_000543 [Pythium oligandrum]|eukprot:TMW60501.1 hypothetical protein Poli38472_000543 [Pythium oligandrum]